MSLNGKKILVLIPARAGSKRLPGKNLLPLNGKPLIAWSILAAKACAAVDRVVVSTEDRKIAAVARRYGADTPFMRPAELAGDRAKTSDVILHAMKELERAGGGFDIVVLLQPTSPCRTARHVREALAYFFRKKADAVVSVCRAHHKPMWTNRLPKDRSMDGFLWKDRGVLKGSPDEAFYSLNGAIYIADCCFFKKNKDWYSRKTFAYEMPVKDSVDIDTRDDFRLAGFLMGPRSGKDRRAL